MRSIRSRSRSRTLITSISASNTLGAPVNLVAPVISGNDLFDGSNLSVSNGTWSNSPTSYTYQWYRSGVLIPGATNNTYTKTSTDAEYGVYLYCEVKAYNAAAPLGVAAVTDNFLVVQDPSTFAARYYDSNDSFISGTTPRVDGQGVQSVNDKVGTVDCDWIGVITGKCEKISDNNYGNWKSPVACIATSNITLSGEQTIDGVLTSASRVLVAGQTTASQNGVYVSAAGAWTRATDCDTAAEVQKLTVRVTGGTVYANTVWFESGTVAITLGTTALNFTQIASTITPYPVFHQEDGGFIHIRNTDAKKFETGVISYSGSANIIHLIRLTGGTDNEYWTFVSNGASWRDRDAGTGNTTQVGAFNNLISLSPAVRMLPSIVYKLTKLEISRSPSGNVIPYINDVEVGGNFHTTSTTSLDMTTLGSSVNAVIGTGLSYIVGTAIEFVSRSTPTKKFNGLVTAYNSATGDVTIETITPSGAAGAVSDFEVDRYLTTGTNNVQEHVHGGSNSHHANSLIYKSLIYTGLRNTVTEGKITKFFEKRHAALGSYMKDTPSITFDPSGVYNDQETWNTADKSINAPTYVFRSPLGLAQGATECRLYTSQSGTQATAITQRTYVEGSLQIRGVSARFGKYIRGTDYGTAPGTTTNVFYWMEFIGVDSMGNRAVIETQTQGINDNQA